MVDAVSSFASTLATPSLASNLPATRVNGKSLDGTAKNFESMFMAQMLQPMTESVDVDDAFGGGHGEEMMRSMLAQEYGKGMAATDRSGLSDAIKADMIRLQSHLQAQKTGGAL